MEEEAWFTTPMNGYYNFRKVNPEVHKGGTSGFMLSELTVNSCFFILASYYTLFIRVQLSHHGQLAHPLPEPARYRQSWKDR